jgi:hypothetical protein
MVNSENMGHLDHEVAGGQRTSRRRAAQFSPWIASVSETSVPSNAQGAIGVAPNDFAEHLGGLEWFFLLRTNKVPQVAIDYTAVCRDAR